MYRTLGGLVAVLAGALVLVALSFRASLPGRADFTFVNGSEPETLDPARMTGAIEGRIADAIFEGLTRRDPATLRPVPGVAKSWEVSPDGLTWTFHLRDDARWTDGRPVTARDFAWSWRRLEAPELGAAYAYLLFPLRHAEDLDTGRARAAALRGPILRAFDALRRAHPEGVPAAAWRRFLAEGDAVGALRGTRDPLLRRALAGGAIAAGDLPALRAALLAEAGRREARAALAERHFGVDEGVFARDDRTLVVELAAPVPYFLQLTAFFPTFPVPRQAVEASPQDWFLPGRIVSNGPFELEAWRVGDRIRLRRSPSYWGRDAVGVETVDALPIENLTTALNLYLSGAVDWIRDTPSDLVDALRTRPDHYSGPGFSVYYYRVNVRRPPLDDPRVREALALAIDREAITRDVLGLGQLPAYHIVPPGVPGYEPPPSALRFDPRRARALLARAGFPGGAGFPELGILYNTLESHKKIAEVVADQLSRNLGIRVKPYNQEWQAYLASTLAGDYDLARAGWIGDYLDPNTFLDIWVTDGGNNQTGWSDPLYDRLIHAAADPARRALDAALPAQLTEPARTRALQDALRRAPDAAARREAAAALRMQLLREAEAILVQRGFPVIPIYFYVVEGMVAPRVQGFYTQLHLPDGTRVPNLQDLHPLRGIRVERP